MIPYGITRTPWVKAVHGDKESVGNSVLLQAQQINSASVIMGNTDTTLIKLATVNVIKLFCLNINP